MESSNDKLNETENDSYSLQDFMEFLLVLYLSRNQSSKDIFIQNLINDRVENKRKKLQFQLTQDGKNHAKHHRNNKEKIYIPSIVIHHHVSPCIFHINIL